MICGLAVVGGAFSASGATITIVAGPGLSANAPALAAFNAAADVWEARLLDPITITINADLAALAVGVIGSASSSLLFGDNYAEVRDGMVADAQKEVSLGQSEDAITTFLPTFSQLTVKRPAGWTLSDTMVITKANAKALAVDVPAMGYTPAQLDSLFGVSDGQITFSSNFSFDYDSSDGVTPGSMDFLTVAAHEIGHTLGFISTLDDIDGGVPGTFALTTLDLYRFQNTPTDLPGSATGFTTAPRSLTPGMDEAFSDTTQLWRFSTGSTSGDGQQGSHWKDNNLTGTLLGMMDPTLATGQIFPFTEADFHALDLIGWNVVPLVPVPEPGGVGAVVLALGLAAARRRRVAAPSVSA